MSEVIFIMSSCSALTFISATEEKLKYSCYLDQISAISIEADDSSGARNNSAGPCHHAFFIAIGGVVAVINVENADNGRAPIECEDFVCHRI